MKSLKQAMNTKGLHLVIGGKSLGKTKIVKTMVEEGGDAALLYVDMRLPTVARSSDRNLTNVRRPFVAWNRQNVPPWLPDVSAMLGAMSAALARADFKKDDSVDGGLAQAFSFLLNITAPEDFVNAFCAAAVAGGQVPVIMIDEANLAFPTNGNAGLGDLVGDSRTREHMENLAEKGWSPIQDGSAEGETESQEGARIIAKKNFGAIIDRQSTSFFDEALKEEMFGDPNVVRVRIIAKKNFGAIIDRQSTSFFDEALKEEMFGDPNVVRVLLPPTTYARKCTQRMVETMKSSRPRQAGAAIKAEEELSIAASKIDGASRRSGLRPLCNPGVTRVHHLEGASRPLQLRNPCHKGADCPRASRAHHILHLCLEVASRRSRAQAPPGIWDSDLLAIKAGHLARAGCQQASRVSRVHRLEGIYIVEIPATKAPTVLENHVRITQCTSTWRLPPGHGYRRDPRSPSPACWMAPVVLQSSGTLHCRPHLQATPFRRWRSATTTLGPPGTRPGAPGGCLRHASANVARGEKQ
eukprot:s6100_g2.t1